MSDTKGGRTPAHAAYGLAVALALSLGFAAGWLTQAAYAPPAPDEVSARLGKIEENTKTLLHRQTHLLRKLVSEHDTDWDRGR